MQVTPKMSWPSFLTWIKREELRWRIPRALVWKFYSNPRLWLYHELSVSVESSWNVMAHGDTRGGGEWRGNWPMQWVVSTLHTTSEHGVSSITTADAHTSAASSRLNWRPRQFEWTRPFRRKTKSGFCVCAITFQLTSTPSVNQSLYCVPNDSALDTNMSKHR